MSYIYFSARDNSVSDNRVSFSPCFLDVLDILSSPSFSVQWPLQAFLPSAAESQFAQSIELLLRYCIWCGLSVSAFSSVALASVLILPSYLHFPFLWHVEEHLVLHFCSLLFLLSLTLFPSLSMSIMSYRSKNLVFQIL